MKRLLPLFAAVLLVCALAFVVRSLDKAAPPDHDEDEAPTSQAAPKSALAASADAELPPEETFGPADAQYKFTVGWVYDEANQPNTKPLRDALQAVKEVITKYGAASVEIVNVDVPPEDRSPAAQAVTEPGVAFKGVQRPEFAGNPGEGALAAPNMGHVMDAVAQGK